MINDDSTINGNNDGTNIFAELYKTFEIPSAHTFGNITNIPKNTTDMIHAIILFIKSPLFNS